MNSASEDHDKRNVLTGLCRITRSTINPTYNRYQRGAGVVHEAQKKVGAEAPTLWATLLEA